MSIIEVLARVIITFAVLLFMARINGPKQIAQMSFYDYVSGITVGSAAATICTDSSVSFVTGLAVIVFFLGTTIIINIITQQNLSLSKLFTGSPIVLIAKGNIQWDNMRRSKLTIGELLSSLRTSGYFNVNDVYEAVLETNGKISILPKEYRRAAQVKDMKQTTSDPVLTTEVILDGDIQHHNLNKFGKNETWLLEELRKQKVEPQMIHQIILAVLDDKGSLVLYFK